MIEYEAAIDSISDASADNPYLVWVAPGEYNEIVTLKPFVHLQGAGQEATIITSTANGVDFPPQATLLLASDTSLRDLTVSNGGAGDYNTALSATEGMTRTLVKDVSARAQGGGTSNYAIVLIGNDVGVTLEQVTAVAENGSSNFGLVNYSGATATLRGGSFTGSGGTDTCGIHNSDSTSMLIADSVTVLAENGGNTNYGLWNVNSAAATLRGSSLTGRGGTDASGINNDGSGTTLESENSTALGENGSSVNYGLYNYNGAAATLHGDSFTARGGSNTHGIYNMSNNATLVATNVTVVGEEGSSINRGLFNASIASFYGGSITGRGGVTSCGIDSEGSSTTLEAENITAVAKDSSNFNYGFLGQSGGTAMLRGGSFIGHGGTYAYGMFNIGGSTTLEAENISALGKIGSTSSYGLYNYSGATATLRGSSITARGGTNTYGIDNNGYGTTLEAESVTALAEDGTNSNKGLSNSYSAATLFGSSLTGRGGSNAYGIYNVGTNAALAAESVTALGENGSSVNYGLQNSDNATTNITQCVLEGATNSVYRNGGSVTVSNGRLAGSGVSGTVTCVLVTRGSTISTNGSTCP